VSWKVHSDTEFFFSLDEGPHEGQILAKVYETEDPPAEEVQWCWHAEPPDVVNIDRGGDWGWEPTREEAQKAAEAYLERHGVLVT
jgi:hypothetical protein